MRRRLGEAGVLFALLHPGQSHAQPAPGGPAVLSGVTAKADVRGRQGLLLSFDRPAPLYSILGDGTDQPIVAFAGAVEASGLAVQPSAAAALAAQVSIQPAGGVLDVRFKTTSTAHLSITPAGDRAVLVTLGDAAVTTGVAASPSKVMLDPDEDGFEVVPLKYADVSEIVGLLTGEQGVRPNDSFTPQEPAFGSATMNNGGAPPPAPAGASAFPPAIGNDRRLNAIILRGPPELIARLKAKIAKLDTPVTSVLLETVFVELTESGARNVGLDLSNASNQVATLGYGVNTTTQGLSGLKSFGTASLQAAIYAQVKNGEGRIISKPRISAQSGQSAKIITGDAVPILTSITLSGVNGVSQQVQYVTVGVTLQIAPRVSDDGYVTSHVFCEVSSVTGSSQGYPTISQREATTSATVKDGQSFVIGGLTQENAQETGSKVPGLGGLPGLGKLFSLQQSTRSKTDLYIVVTPQIVRAGAEPQPLPPVVRSSLKARF